MSKTQDGSTGTGAEGGVDVDTTAELPVITESQLSPTDPQRLGQYRLVATLGAGEHGVVYVASTPDGDRVAIRLANQADSRSRRLFATVASRPVPPFSTARVLEFGVHKGRPYLVNEYVDGLSVAQLLAEERQLDPVVLYGIAIGSMAALVGLHDSGQVHGNLKPTTVMVTLGGVRLVDHGLTKPAKGTQGRADDLHQWARLVRYAANMPASEVDEGDGIGTAQAAAMMPQALRGIVASAATADPERGPTGRELLLALSTAAPAARRAAPSPGRQRVRYMTAVGAAAAVIALSFASSARSHDHAPASATVPLVTGAPSAPTGDRAATTAAEPPPTSASVDPVSVPAGGVSTPRATTASEPALAPRPASTTAKSTTAAGRPPVPVRPTAPGEPAPTTPGATSAVPTTPPPPTPAPTTPPAEPDPSPPAGI